MEVRVEWETMKSLSNFISIFVLSTAISFASFSAIAGAIEQTSPSSVTALQKHLKISHQIQDFRYATAQTDPNFRDLYRLDCDLNTPNNTSLLKYAYNPDQNLKSPAYELIASTPWCDSELRFKLQGGQAANAFDQMDFETITHLNRTFYGEAFEAATISFQHGRKTKKVYVFIPGFSEDNRAFLATGVRMFQRGHNVIIGTLPGFANKSWDISQIQAGHWILYADYMIRSARAYGEKVIVVGSSSGANLGTRIAENGERLVDGLFLIQPFFGYSNLAKVAISVGPKVPHALIAYVGRKLSLAEMDDTRPIFAQMDRLLHNVFSRGKKLSIPVVAVIAENDEAVSSKETLRWLEMNANTKAVLRHRHGHLHRPTDSDVPTWNQLIAL